MLVRLCDENGGSQAEALFWNCDHGHGRVVLILHKKVYYLGKSNKLGYFQGTKKRIMPKSIEVIEQIGKKKREG